jgi:hypothetical protein
MSLRLAAASCGSVGSQLVGDDPLWAAALFPQQPHQQALRGLGVAADLEDFIKNRAILINGTPERSLLAFDRNHHFVQMPDIVAAYILRLGDLRLSRLASSGPNVMAQQRTVS